MHPNDILIYTGVHIGTICKITWIIISPLPKWRPAAFWKKISKKKVVYWSKMARNAFESDFRSSKMAAGSHFVKKKLCIDLKWREMWSKVICGHPKWPPADILWKKSKLRIDLKGRELRSKVIFVIQNWGGGGASQWPACKPFGDIHSICPWANTTILVSHYTSSFLQPLRS